MAARLEEGCYEKVSTQQFLVRKRPSNADVEAARGAPYFPEIRPGAGFKTGDFFEEKFGGGTVERLFNTTNSMKDARSWERKKKTQAKVANKQTRSIFMPTPAPRPPPGRQR